MDCAIILNWVEEESTVDGLDVVPVTTTVSLVGIDVDALGMLIFSFKLFIVEFPDEDVVCFAPEPITF